MVHTIYQNNLYFVKSSDQIIIQIIRKTISILMFLIKPNNCFTGRYLKPSQHRRVVFVVLLVCSLQPSTNVTNNSILGDDGVLDSPLEL